MYFDYKCQECGNEERDIWVKTSDEEVPCKICDATMTKQLTGFQARTKSKTERMLPDNYKFSSGANFGKLKDGWY